LDADPEEPALFSSWLLHKPATETEAESLVLSVQGGSGVFRLSLALS
jgi:hypothetical protein